MRVLGVIPARGGSKGIPRKNLHPVGGRPLLAWTIDAARGARGLSRCVVSTEDDEIAGVARSFGGDVPFLRPAELATDETPGSAPILHALDEVEARDGASYDAVMCLQPTSPLRTSADIDAALALLDDEVAAVISVAPARHHPLWMRTMDERGRLLPLSGSSLPARRQDLPRAYVLNGAVYIARQHEFRAARTFHLEGARAYVMPEERSIDVDTPLDAQIAGMLLAARRNEGSDG